MLAHSLARRACIVLFSTASSDGAGVEVAGEETMSDECKKEGSKGRRVEGSKG